MIDDLSEIEKLASDMLRRVSAGERRRLLRTISRRVQASQRARIARQQAPDGERFAPRKDRTSTDKPGAHPLKFLYPKGEAEPRVVFMRSWVHQGRALSGYDIEKGAIRTFFWDKIAKYLPVDPAEDSVTGPLPRRRRLRDRAMFRKLSSARFLRAGADENEAWVGFDGRASAIGWVHQDGLRDKPAPNAKAIRYARRVLLGLSSADQAMVMNMLMEHVSSSR